jgi:hypothetical protein
MTTDAIAYAVRVLRTRKDGSQTECWLASGTLRGSSGALHAAMLFPSANYATSAAQHRGATIARIVPIVALEEAP